MRHLRPLATALLLVVAAATACPQEARAQLDLGARLGYDLEVEELLIGIEGRFATPGVDVPVQLKPSVDYFLVDGFTVLQIDANGLYHFDIDNEAFTPYAGAGLGVTYMAFDTEFDDAFGISGSDTDVGINLIGGAVFGAGPLRPFGEARVKLGGDLDVFSIVAGVLYRLDL